MILRVTAGFLGMGLGAFIAWWLTANDAWVEKYFQWPGAILTVALASVGLVFSLRARQEFAPGQPLRTAWTLIAGAAGCELAGAVALQVLGANSGLNPLPVVGLWSSATGNAIRQTGFVLGGSVRFSLLAAGLLWALKVYRRSGFLGRLRWTDWVLLFGAGAYVVREAWDLMTALQHGKHPGLVEILGWPTDPLLSILLAEALLLFRSVQRMGAGWIGKCWKAFAIGISLVVLGDLALWATNYGFLPWPWSALSWYVWLPASGFFAAAPAYQLETLCHAREPLDSSYATGK